MLHSKLFATLFALLFLCIGNAQSDLDLSQAKTGFLYPGLAGDYYFDCRISDDTYTFKNVDWLQRYTEYYSLQINPEESPLKNPQHYLSTVIADARANKRANLVLLDLRINVFKPNVFLDRILQKKYDGSIIDHSNGKVEVFDVERVTTVGIQLPADNSAAVTELYLNPDLFVSNVTKKGVYRVEFVGPKNTYMGNLGGYISIPTTALINTEWTIKIYFGTQLLNEMFYTSDGSPHNPDVMELPPYTSCHVLGLSDVDGDHVPDIYDNCPNTPNGKQLDLDGDGIGDVCDDDKDGDGILNVNDNCPYKYNPGQEDQDNDGIGDLCDYDYDNDGISDVFDNCPETPNFAQLDTDEDGEGDACDDDIDGDGVPNDEDICPEIENADQMDQDGDGIGDLCDDDIDGDGILNDEDNCPEKANANQTDSNDNGIGDMCDDGTIPSQNNNCTFSPSSQGGFSGTQTFVVGPPGTPGADLVIPSVSDFETYSNFGNPAINSQANGSITYAIYQNPSRTTVTAPIIVVDGFDPAGTRSIPDIVKLFGGDSRILDFWAQGFDLIIVDFDGGADFMQRNALVLQDFIVDLKDEYKLDEIPAVVGPSMGGQIVRYMLLDWEQNKTDQFGPHGIQTFISVDSPWEGANVAPSLQAMIKQFINIINSFTLDPVGLLVRNGLGDNSEMILESDKKLNSPAARQMMLANVNSNTFQITGFNKSVYFKTEAHPLRDQWVAELNGMGNVPTEIGNLIGTADGSVGAMNGQVEPFEVYFNIRKVFNIANLHAVGGGMIVSGYVKVISLTSGNNLDSAPGSKFPLASNLGGIPDSSFPSDPLSVCFIPTFSALGIAGGTPDMSINFGSGPNGFIVTGSPFDQAFFDSNDSDHIAFDNVNIPGGNSTDDFTFFANNTESNESTYSQCDHLQNYVDGNISLLDVNHLTIECVGGNSETTCLNPVSEFPGTSTFITQTGGPSEFNASYYGNTIVVNFTGYEFTILPATFEVCTTINTDGCPAKTICETLTVSLEMSEDCDDIFVLQEPEDNNIDTRSSSDNDELTTPKSLQIMPNPTDGVFKISNDQPGNISIMDVSGKMIHRQVAEMANQTIHVDLNPGLYFVKFAPADNTEYEVSKLIIQQY